MLIIFIVLRVLLYVVFAPDNANMSILLIKLANSGDDDGNDNDADLF